MLLYLVGLNWVKRRILGEVKVFCRILRLFRVATPGQLPLAKTKQLTIEAYRSVKLPTPGRALGGPDLSGRFTHTFLAFRLIPLWT